VTSVVIHSMGGSSVHGISKDLIVQGIWSVNGAWSIEVYELDSDVEADTCWTRSATRVSPSTVRIKMRRVISRERRCRGMRIGLRHTWFSGNMAGW
jgi:hypothetical protein